MLKPKTISANIIFAMQAAAVDGKAMNAILAGKIPEGVDVREWRKTWGEDLRAETDTLADADNATLFQWAAQQMKTCSMTLLGQLKPVVLEAMIANDDWSDLYLFRQGEQSESPVIGVWAVDSREARDGLIEWVKSQREAQAKGELDKVVNNWQFAEAYIIRAE